MYVKAMGLDDVRTESAVDGVFWAGRSLLLRSVVSSLAGKIGSQYIHRALLASNNGPTQGFLIHDGQVSEQVKLMFTLDFDINHFGDRPERIASELAMKLISGLV
jgi:hypothetical protein